MWLPDTKDYFISLGLLVFVGLCACAGSVLEPITRSTGNCEPRLKWVTNSSKGETLWWIACVKDGHLYQNNVTIHEWWSTDIPAIELSTLGDDESVFCGPEEIHSEDYEEEEEYETCPLDECQGAGL